MTVTICCCKLLSVRSLNVTKTGMIYTKVTFCLWQTGF